MVKIKGAVMKVLAFSAHQDDETLGAGGTLAKHMKAGDTVRLCIVTSGYKPKWTKEVLKLNEDEAFEVQKILGIEQLYFLKFHAAQLDVTPQQELNDIFIKIINDFKPEVVYTPYIGDIHHDHRAVFESVLVATRPVKGSPVKRVLAYEVASSTEWGALRQEQVFNPNVFVDITDTLDIKLQAFQAYKRQVRTWPHPRSVAAVENHAKYRGTCAGMDSAEAFMLIREIHD
jgi:LmbE family N-acetylglucosaminyl deacetylase